jgi:disulfide bond formation protein DsbB
VSNQQDGDRGRKQATADAALIENSVDGSLVPVHLQRSTGTALARPGVVQAGVVGLNVCVAAVVSTSHTTGLTNAPGLSVPGALLTLDVALLLVFFLAAMAERRRDTTQARGGWRYQRSSLAGFIAATVAVLVAVFSEAGSLLALVACLAMLSAAYLAASVAGYALLERQRIRVEAQRQRLGANVRSIRAVPDELSPFDR